MYRRIAISTADDSDERQDGVLCDPQGERVDRLNATSKTHPNSCASTHANAKNVRKIQFRTTLCTAAITRCDAFVGRCNGVRCRVGGYTYSCDETTAPIAAGSCANGWRAGVLGELGAI